MEKKNPTYGGQRNKLHKGTSNGEDLSIPDLAKESAKQLAFRPAWMNSTSICVYGLILYMKRNVSCPIVGCGAQLNSLDDFEDHYHARHTASCSVCSRVYPTSRLLSIHVSEAHDSFFQAKVARGFAMYECLVEGCGVKLKSYKSRQQHLIDKHKFPTSFEFFKKAQPSKKQRQKSHQRKQVNSKESKEIKMEVEGKIDDLVSAVSKLSTSDSPSAVSFGHRHARGFSFLPRSVQRNKKHDSMQTDSVTPS